MRSKIFLFSFGLVLVFCFNSLFAQVNMKNEIPKGLSLPVNSFYRIEIPKIDVGRIYSTSVIFSEDFESGIGSWSVSGGVWEVGIPTSGPNSAHSGSKVAATSLAGNYPDNADALLKSPDIGLPSSGIITLKFYHWYQTESGYDYCYLVISTDGGTNWQTLRTYNGFSGRWVLENLNLSAYAGRTVKLGFRFTSDASITYAGWYIDDISVEVSTTNVPGRANIALYFDQINSANFPNINCYVTVVDSAGNPISGLADSNFVVYEDGVLQSPIAVTLVGTTQIPISVALVIDRSGSMSGQPISDAKIAASSFVDNMKPSDRGAIISFSSNVTVDQSFTSDKNALKNAINSISAGGNTAIYNAAFTALSLLSAEVTQRKSVILLTDGADNSSTITPDSVIRYANQLGIPIHTIGLGLSPGSAEEQALIYLSQSTGGRYYYAPNSSQLSELYNLISAQIQGQYRISYTTSNPRYDNTIRTVKVVVNYLSSYDTAVKTYRAPSAENWTIKISARSDSLADINNFAGVNFNATDSLDLYDVPEPPAPMNNFLQLYFPHPEWNHILGPLYSKDIKYARALKSQTIQWYFEVNTDALNKQVTIEVIPDSLFPSNYLIVLEDLSNGVKTIINENNTYSYNTGTGGIRRFRLVVGKLFVSNAFSAGWNLAGVPLNLDSISINSFFADDISTPFYIYNYSSSIGYELSNSFNLGKGFWLGLISGANVDIYGSYFDDTLEVGLNKFWNIISPPYLSVATKNSIFIERSGMKVSLDSAASLGWILGVFYGYNGSSYLLVDSLSPWKGYWFASLIDSVKLVFTPSSGVIAPRISLPDLIVSDRNWRIYLGVENDKGASDKLALFGVKDDATDSFDLKYDYPKPPNPPGNASSVQIYFYHPEWNFVLGPYFASDIRQPFTSVKSWKFYVKNNSNVSSEIKLTWNITEVPSNFDLILKDVSTGLTVDMRRQYNYRFNAAAGEVREFAFDAVTYIEETSEIPVKYALYQNYPNPFNPLTTIEFDIPEKTSVKLIIYDVLGKDIAVVVDGELEPGKYKVNFNASGLPSGVYFYHLKAGKFSSVKKMILLK